MLLLLVNRYLKITKKLTVTKRLTNFNKVSVFHFYKFRISINLLFLTTFG